MADPFDLTGRVALVTGASGGIGGTCAAALAERGAHVFLGTRDGSRVTAGIDAIRKRGGAAAAWVYPLGDPRAAEDGINAIVATAGSLDIVVNCAGTIARTPLAEMEETGWSDVMSANLTQPFTLARLAARPMIERKWGRIINVASILSLHGKPNALAYVASKHGLAGLTRALATELAQHGICVNALCPGYFRTDLTAPLQESEVFNDLIQNRVPAKRWGEPKELVGPLLLLASESGSFVNGHLLVVDGGLTVSH